jgi:AraC-like DNA-binding protein
MSIYDILKDRRRLELDLSSIGLPEVPLVGVNIQTSAAESLAAHRHKGIFEVVYMVRGRQVFTEADKEYTLAGNDIFITRPGRSHGSGPYLMDKAFFYWLQLKLPSHGESILCLDSESSALLSRQLMEISVSRFAGSKMMAAIFEDIFRLSGSDNDIKKLAISSRLVELLLCVSNCAANPENSPITADIKASLQLLADNYDKFLTVEQMAAAAGLSASRFKCKFKKQTGLPPGEYQLRKKVEMAEELLATTDQSITTTAYQLGFSSSQYFATVFKRFKKTTPAQARKISIQ